MRKLWTLLLIGLLLTSLSQAHSVYAQDVTPTPSPDTSQQQKDLQAQIADLQNKIADAQGQEKTLSSQISIFNNQITLTEYKIEQTKEQILAVEQDIDTAQKKITSLDGSLQSLMKVFVSRVVATYQSGTTEPINILLTSNDVNNFVTRSNYLKLVQAHDKQLVLDTYQAKNDYSNQKNILEDKRQKILALQQQLVDYNSQLDDQKKQKQQLLAATQGSEANYQRLLSAAQAQLAAFTSFTTSQGGASILPPQPSPDGWFYSQRDQRWGNMFIGSSTDTVWEVGCLLTSIAMVLKYNGQSVTPASIAGNAGYFFGGTAYMLIPWAGGQFTSFWSGSTGSIDNLVAAGKPVIVGLKAGAFGMHFVVIKGGSGGNYMINDPWYGYNQSFATRYTTSEIFQYGYKN